MKTQYLVVIDNGWDGGGDVRAFNDANELEEVVKVAKERDYLWYVFDSLIDTNDEDYT